MSESLDLTGRVALVTGAGRGMGRTHALVLAARGAEVVVNDLGSASNGDGQSEAPAKQVADEINALGGSAIPDTHDVSTEAGTAAMVRSAISQFGKLDILVHNAGVVSFVPLSEMTYLQYRNLVAVHQDGAFLLCKAAWPQFLKQRYGRVILITSLASIAGLTHYASAKAAVSGFARCLALEGAPNNINVNALSVVAYTRLMAAFFDPNSGHADLGLFGQRAIEDWWRGNLKPEQVSQVVAWLAHESCQISGETLFTGGGQVSLQFIGLTPGRTDVNLTPETLAANCHQILSTKDSVKVEEGLGWLFSRLVAAGVPPLPAPKPLERAESPRSLNP